MQVTQALDLLCRMMTSMNIIIPKRYLYSKYRLSAITYNRLVNEFLELLRRSYILKCMKVYKIKYSTAYQLVVIKSYSDKYLVGIQSPMSYSSTKISELSRKILKLEYGSLSTSIKPRIRNYASILTKSVKYQWLQYYYYKVEEV